MRLIDVGTCVNVAGLTVRHGDILHGDEHRVLQIPAEALPGIIGKAKEIRNEEQAIVSWSRSAGFSIGTLLQLRRVRHYPALPQQGEDHGSGGQPRDSAASLRY